MMMKRKRKRERENRAALTGRRSCTPTCGFLACFAKAASVCGVHAGRFFGATASSSARKARPGQTPELVAAGFPVGAGGAADRGGVSPAAVSFHGAAGFDQGGGEAALEAGRAYGGDDLDESDGARHHGDADRGGAAESGGADQDQGGAAGVFDLAFDPARG